MHLIDLHCDTPSAMYDIYSNKRLQLSENELKVDISKLKMSNSMAQFFAMFIDSARTDLLFEKTELMLKYFKAQLQENSSSIVLTGSYEQMLKNSSNGLISAFITIEGGELLEGSIDKLKYFYEEGIRLITLTWNHENELGYPNSRKLFTNSGLKSRGIEILEGMNSLGIIADVSHLSDGGFYDVAKYSKKPFLASHSNCREVTKHQRNLTDEMIKMLADKGGLMGLNFEPGFVGRIDSNGIEGLIQHVKHAVKIGGIDVVAIGSDFDGTYGDPEISDISKINLLEKELKASGFSPSEIEKIFYKNAASFLKEVL